MFVGFDDRLYHLHPPVCGETNYSNLSDGGSTTTSARATCRGGVYGTYEATCSALSDGGSTIDAVIPAAILLLL